MHASMIVGLSFLLAGASLARQKYETISYRSAADHVGEIVWVEGTVVRTESSREGTLLVFSANPKYLRVIVPTEHLSNFDGGLNHLYVGKKIRAIGKIEQVGTKLLLGVNEPKRIQIVGGKGTS